MIEFFQYWKLVGGRAFSIWSGFVWSNFLLASLITLGTFIGSAVAKSGRDTLLGAMRQWWEAPMGSFTELAWGGVGVLALIGISGLVCLFLVAPAQIHSEQLMALNKSRDELKHASDELKEVKSTSLPQLNAEVQSIMGGPIDLPDMNIKGQVLALWTIVRNAGAPSIVEKWKVSVTLADGREVVARIVCFEPQMVMSVNGEDGTQAFTKLIEAKKLIIRTAAQPIPNGGAAYGYITALFKDTEYDELFAKGAKLQLEFADIRGRMYSIATDDTHSLKTIPGTEPSMLGEH